MTAYILDKTIIAQADLSDIIGVPAPAGPYSDDNADTDTTDHRKLKYRSAENQHPISAISNLGTELQNRVVAGNALTNLDIEKLLGGN